MQPIIVDIERLGVRLTQSFLVDIERLDVMLVQSILADRFVRLLLREVGY